MTDSLSDLLNNARHGEPLEISVIKKFVLERYNHSPQVTIREKQIIISVSSAALAGTLRMQLHELQALCQTKKRLVIRIN